MREIRIQTRRRTEMVDITQEVESVIKESKIDEGVCIVYCPHTTAGLTINENADPSVRRDIEETMEKLVPYGAGYHHLEGNADSHIKASIIGSSLNLIVTGGRPVLGTWQGIFFCEFDGPRSRRVIVQVIGK